MVTYSNKNTSSDFTLLRLQKRVSELELKLEEYEIIKDQFKNRKKELSSLHKLVELFYQKDLNPDRLYKTLVEILPSAFQYPDFTKIHLEIDKKSFSTPGYKDTPWKFSSDICTTKETVGKLTIALTKEFSTEYNGPFLQEECELIETYAGSLSRYIEFNRQENELVYSENYFRTTLHSIGDAVIVTEKNGRIVQMNPISEALTGWSFHDAKNQPIEKVFQIVNALTGKKAENPVKKVLEYGLVVGLANHTKLISRNANEYQISDSAAPIKNESGEVLGVVMVFRDVTQSYKMQNDLLKSQQQFLTLFEDSPIPTSLATIDDCIYKQVNSAWCKFTGFTNTEVINKSYDELKVLDKETRVYLRKKLFDEGKVEQIEIQVKTKSGQKKDVLSSMKILPVGDEKLIMNSFLDITERKITEKETLEQEQRYRSTLDKMIEGCQILDFDFKYVYLNDMALKHSTKTRNELIGHKMTDVFPSMKGAKVLDCIKVCMKERKSDQFENKFFYEDGSVGWFHLMIQPTKEGVLISSIDITEQKLALTKVIEAKEEAERNQEYFMTLIEKSPLPMVVTDENQNMEFINEKLTTQFGYTIEDVKTAEEWWCCLCPDPEYRERVKNEWNKAKDEAYKNKKEIESQIWEMVARDGSKRICEFDMMPIGQKNLVIIQDITQRKQAEAEHNRLLEQLAQAQKMESIGRLAGGVAHDYNNMLNVILGYAEMSLRKIHKGLPINDDLGEIIHAARRSSDITRQLLAFARKQTIKPVVLDLNETIQGLVKMLHRLIGEDIQLNFKPFEKIWAIKVDPTQIDQVLMNLSVNSRDAISGVGKIDIKTGNTSIDESFCENNPGSFSGDYVFVSFSDNGCGMYKSTKAQVFEPFFTTKKVGEGSGLGLSTVYGIMKQNEGFINVYSEPGKGTTFNLYFPRYDKPAMKQDQTISSIIPFGSGETVLVVDDEQAIMKMAKMMLEMLNYKVISAASPSEALQKDTVGDSKIDLLITDVVMPQMNGHDLAEKLQENHPELKTIFMSGYTSEIITNRGMLEDDMLFIQKPFTKNELAIKVREALGK